MNVQELRSEVEQQAALMVAVATGGPQINSVNDEYANRRSAIRAELQRRGLDDPNQFRDLWAWYGYYSQNLPRWHERRTYISELYEPLHAQLDALGERDIGSRLDEEERTGWERVDDQVVQLRQRYNVALTVEDFQAVGLLCRDIFVSLDEAVFDSEEHVPAERERPEHLRDRLFAVVEHEAPGSANRELRALLKASIDYANKVQHDRMATRHHARTVAEATMTTVNLMRTLLVAAEEQAHEAAQEEDLDAIRRAWNERILPALEDRSIPVASVFREARPIEFDEGRLVLQFSPAAAFHRHLAEEPRNAALLADVLDEVIGRRPALDFQVGGDAG